MNAEYRGLSPLNILLAEDERAVAFSVAFALKCDGHNVQVVADGWQALASIDVEPDRFALLITDHSMPGITGIELIQRLRAEFLSQKEGGELHIFSAAGQVVTTRRYEPVIPIRGAVGGLRGPKACTEA